MVRSVRFTRRRHVHADVARVRQRVPEAEHGLVLPLNVAAAAAVLAGDDADEQAEAAVEQHADDDGSSVRVFAAPYAFVFLHFTSAGCTKPAGQYYTPQSTK